MISAGRDNQILVWDIRFENKITAQGWPMVLPIQKISVPSRKKSLSTITSVVFVKNGRSKVLASSSSVNSTIKFWDLRDTRYPVYNANPIENFPRDYGIGYLKVNNTGDKLYASGMNSRIYELDTIGFDNTNSYSHPDFEPDTR